MYKILLKGKVICIDTSNGPNNDSTVSYLTLNKSYDVIGCISVLSDQLVLGLNEYNILYKIVCDDGLERKLLDKRFVTLEVHREGIINKILK
jgi:hypothetical protein